MNLTENQVLDALKSVIDPEIGINIVDLGLIYKVRLEEKEITIDLTLTTPGCPMHDGMPDWVRESLKRLSPDASIEVNLVWNPKWTPKLMSQEAKKQLGF